MKLKKFGHGLEVRYMHLKCCHPPEVTACWLWEKKFGGLVAFLVSATSIFTRFECMKVQGSKVMVMSNDCTQYDEVHVTYQMKAHFKSYI